MGIAVVVILAALAAFVYAVRRINKFKPVVTADEVHMVTTPDLWRIRLCRYKPAAGKGEPILLCHGFMSNQFNFSRPAGDAMVDYLARQGYDCWAIDLRGNKSSVPPFGRKRSEPTMDDYLLKDLPSALDYIRKATGYAQVHWIGHSMGGMLLYAYDAVFGSNAIASAATMGSPTGFKEYRMSRPACLLAIRRASGALSYFGQWLIVQALGRWRKNLSFIPVNWQNMDPRLDTKALFSMLEVPPVQVAETIVDSVVRQEWRVNGGETDVFAHIPNLSVPLLSIVGSADLFLPAAEGEAALAQIAIADKRCHVLSKANGCLNEYNHVDLVMSGEAHKEVFPVVEEWLRAHPIPREKDEEDTADDWRPILAAKKAQHESKVERADEVLAAEPTSEAADAPAAAPKKRKAATKKTPAKKTPAKKTTAKKATAKKATAKKTPAKKTVAKASTSRAKSPATARKKAATAKEAAKPAPAPAKKRTSGHGREVGG